VRIGSGSFDRVSPAAQQFYAFFGEMKGKRGGESARPLGA
jgi:hypothetical protein